MTNTGKSNLKKPVETGRFAAVRFGLFGAFVLALGTSAFGADPPPLAREFRGVWVATVDNIDWPSKKGLPPARQREELVAILDRCVALKLNAVVFQIRPMCDALYESKLEPWSEYLTGKLGDSPGYDPLAFAVKEAHARGLELHAWFNPYRAHHPSATSPIVADHLVKKRPDLAKKYGKHYWLNPTHPETADHTMAVILDVVKRYDIDGVHLDDYFYPYAEKDTDGTLLPFPDDDTWMAYVKEGGRKNQSDWRRAAVNRFVERLHREVHAAKAWVKVGISPFGIWRPGHPPGIAGFDQYEGLFADAKKWLNEGWVDYFTPQLYWPIKQEKQSYPKLLAWWAGENTKKRHLWPGNIPSRVTGKDKGWPASEIADQVKATRAQAGATGNIHFSMKPLLRNTGGVGDALAEVYREPALAPATPWLGDKAPKAPTVAQVGSALLIRRSDDDVRFFVVRRESAGKWQTMVMAAGDEIRIAASDRVVVTAIGRTGMESAPARP